MLVDKDEHQRETITKWPIWLALKLLSEALILIVSAMFGATFNLVTHVGLPSIFVTLNYGSLEINI